jgi:glycosyltransferase involved in cell wall biosynthesis
VVVGLPACPADNSCVACTSTQSRDRLEGRKVVQSTFAGNGLRVGFVGTYPPTRCGIATFTASLAKGLQTVRPDCRVGVVDLVEGDMPSPHAAEVVARLVAGSPRSRAAAAAALDGFDAVIVQHEFGIFGGEDGSEVLELVESLQAPVLVVLHTVLRRPTPRQRRILERLGAQAERLVVPSEAARTRVLEHYEIRAEKVKTIPHGARLNFQGVPPRLEAAAPLVLSWGLVGPGKGYEFGVEAMAALADMDPAPRYVIVGQTHPKVRQREGEAYRESLRSLVHRLGIGARVEFDDGYHDTHSLLRRVREADVALLPYRSREQCVSGVLVEALASGKPVVATRFPHAEELLGEGSGLLVEHEDPAAIAAALRRLLSEPALHARAASVARRQARLLSWESVGRRYLELVDDVIGRRRTMTGRRTLPKPPFEHLLRLSDRTGVSGYARLTTPRREHGYRTDDVARTLVVVLREPRRPPQLERLAATCLSFLERAQLPDGRFHGRLSPAGHWLDEVGSDDATGRALWAAGVATTGAASATQRERARALFEAGSGFCSPWPRANAFAVLGAAELAASAPSPRPRGTFRLLDAATAGLGTCSSDPAWPWPEPRLTYANAVLAEARIAAGAALGAEQLLEEGIVLLEWLVATETRDGHFSFTPAGGWGPREPRPGFDQQPVEAAAMADACARAFDATGEPKWAERALRAANWFVGANDVGLSLYDAANGGCRDGLERAGVNENEGAESTIALISALQQARRLQAAAASARKRSSASTLAAPMQRSAAP